MKKLVLMLAFIGGSTFAENGKGFSCPDCIFPKSFKSQSSSGQYGASTIGALLGAGQFASKEDRL